MGLSVKGSGTVPACIMEWLEDGCTHRLRGGLWYSIMRNGTIRTGFRGSTGFYNRMGLDVLGG